MPQPPSSTIPERKSLLWAFSAPWYFVLPAITIAVLLAVFPQWDIAVSSAFYDVERGGFYWRQYAFMDVLDVFTNVVSGVFLLGCLGWWLVVQRKYPTRLHISDRMITYLLLVFLIGPTLIVSLGFKEHWGRMRPYEVVQFGGDQPFLPYYVPDGVCEDDCSFPSGHTSRGFYFIALAVAAYGLGWPHRRLILTSAIGFGVLTAALRILEGKHFLSDVVLAAIIVSYVAWVTFRLVFHDTPHRLAR